uniref:EMAP like 1 n=1 Tax=Amphilophus citrinellus TaxID=61819 RepID=A0A3Q0RI63_AMPCI
MKVNSADLSLFAPPSPTICLLHCCFVSYVMFNVSSRVKLLNSLDDTVSASSNMDMEDRVSHLEQRLQLQEDEIQLLKAALADALRRLGYCEEQSQGKPPGGAHAGRRHLATTAAAPPTKGKKAVGINNATAAKLLTLHNSK